jgi:hypothetical protein
MPINATQAKANRSSKRSAIADENAGTDLDKAYANITNQSNNGNHDTHINGNLSSSDITTLEGNGFTVEVTGYIISWE